MAVKVNNGKTKKYMQAFVLQIMFLICFHEIFSEYNVQKLFEDFTL